MKIRLVGENVENGVYEYYDAKKIADDMGLDLIKVADNETPVYKIMDESKYLYDKKKKEKELKKNQVKIEIKEIEITPNIAENDFNIKLAQARKFHEKKFHIKLRLYFQGRTIKFIDLGQEKLYKFIECLNDIYRPDSIPKLEGKKMFCNLRPIKK